MINYIVGLQDTIVRMSKDPTGLVNCLFIPPSANVHPDVHSVALPGTVHSLQKENLQPALLHTSNGPTEYVCPK